MSTSRAKIALYGITLLIVSCTDRGDSPVSDLNSEADLAAVADEREPEPEPEEPDEIGLPCDVKRLLSTRCQACHGEGAKNGTPLLTRDNLLAQSVKVPASTVIERMLIRVAGSDKPMPPMGKGEPLSEADLHLLMDWVERGLPAGRCDDALALP